MSVLARPEGRPVSAPNRTVEPREAFTQQAAPVAQPTTEHVEAETHRWFLFLGIPFVLGATFFGLAIGLGAEWPMIPAFFLGPFVLVASYIGLMLTSDTNTTWA